MKKKLIAALFLALIGGTGLIVDSKPKIGPVVYSPKQESEIRKCEAKGMLAVILHDPDKIVCNPWSRVIKPGQKPNSSSHWRITAR